MDNKSHNSNWAATEEVLKHLYDIDIALKNRLASLENDKDKLGDSYNDVKQKLEELRKVKDQFSDAFADYQNFYDFVLKNGIDQSNKEALNALTTINYRFNQRLEKFEELLNELRKLQFDQEIPWLRTVCVKTPL